MNKDSKNIFESYQFLKEQANASIDPSTVMVRLDQLLDRHGKEMNLPVGELNKLKQFIFSELVLDKYKTFVAQPLKMQSSPVGDADTVNLQPGAVSEPGSPSATGYPQR